MITTYLEDLKDHRRSQGQRYELQYILLFTIMAFLSNAKSYRDISRFINGHFEVLKHYFELKWKRPPRYTTVRNIILGLNGEELEACFRAYTQSLMEQKGGDKINTIAFDGKTLCGS